jgi:AraC-like DNA-binding protein
VVRALDGDTRGIVNAAAGFERFHLDRYRPSEDLAWAVDRYWVVRWDLRDQAAYEQRVVPDPASITRVDELAARLQTTTRRLQRLFADHVGLGPKWVINRYRIHEAAEIAAESAARGPDVDWAQLAIDLGYSDQSHLVRDFTAAVGVPPVRYTRQLLP